MYVNYSEEGDIIVSIKKFSTFSKVLVINACFLSPLTLFAEQLEVTGVSLENVHDEIKQLRLGRDSCKIRQILP